MGKKSRKVKKPITSSPNTTNAVPALALGYPSDGPSEEEVNSVQTTSTSLQRKLDLLSQFAMDNDRERFVKNFVPLDLSPNDSAAYLEDLTTGEEAESQWSNLIAEILTIAAGKGVTKIEGDEVTRAVFYFQHPIFKECDREVTFICVSGEWRAEG
mmetsp:Transcript_2032/g.2720  ORF Transcript_2032/g.2720 Transcript_2032/m.2720 type:complete len:156 (-) Transcript_2032:15-482(-)